MNTPSLEDQIEIQKTDEKLKAMANSKRDMVKPEDELRAIANKGKVFLPGECVPEEIQKLKTNEKLAIVGFAPSWTSTPWDDETFDIWGINELYMQMIAKYGKECRYTHWWEIHNPYSPTKNSPKHHAWMAKCKVPIFMNKRYDEFPTSVVIPKDNIIDFYNQNFIVNNVGASFSDYSNQISVMLALSIMVGYKEIHVYGVDMAQASEYAWQRAACQFFIGYAAGLGIKVLIPTNSELCKYPNFYGFNTDNYARMQVKARIKVIKESMQQLAQQTMHEEFLRSDQKKMHAEKTLEFEISLQRIDDELVKADILLNKNREMEAFLKDAPKESKEFNRKVGVVIDKIVNQNNNLEAQIKELEANKKQLLGQKKQVDQQDYAWEMQYQDSKKSIQLNQFGLQGVIGECKRLLDNNIV